MSKVAIVYWSSTGNTETMFGRLFLFFVSTQIEMGLLYLAKQAKDGHSSREPNAQEKHILISMPELITLMNGITCDVCGKEIRESSSYVKVYVVDGDGVDRVMDSHNFCLNGDNIREWLDLSKLGKVSIVEVDEMEVTI